MSKPAEPPDDAGKDRKPRDVQVHFKHLGERERANFKVATDRTLQSIWDEAYGELKVEKTERDVLQAPADKKRENPVSLMDHLGLSLEQAQAQGLCDKEFEIAAGTGGA